MAVSLRMGYGVEPLGGRTGLMGKGFEGTVGRKLDKEVREGTLRRQRVRVERPWLWAGSRAAGLS